MASGERFLKSSSTAYCADSRTEEPLSASPSRTRLKSAAILNQEDNLTEGLFARETLEHGPEDEHGAFSFRAILLVGGGFLDIGY